MRKAILTVAACAAVLLGSSLAQAATDEEKCLVGRAKAAGKYHSCVQKWLADVYDGYDDAIKVTEKLAKCRIKYARTWTKLQGLSGSATCGGQARYVDNGDGTITDNLSGLVWEKKSRNGDVHDEGNVRTLSTGPPYNGNGTAFTSFLAVAATSLNEVGFAGANDWRLPTFGELQTILLPEHPCSTTPCVDPIFNTGCVAACTVLTCSCTQSLYWSSTTVASSPANAYYVTFDVGGWGTSGKGGVGYVRAVRSSL